uniref:Uncharacterized protein n=1 Tax=Picea glauca TaxID=3330 RepID=A0A101M2X3_PICGL|nr:hypothetical protein ABT39_MTgene3207 [Picea glauca]QHR88473.1 hypothetical protein Q903MT_gene2487 [Picea sitchensis]
MLKKHLFEYIYIFIRQFSLKRALLSLWSSCFTPFEIAVQEESQREMSKPVLLLLKVIARKEINVFRCLILFPKLKIR